TAKVPFGHFHYSFSFVSCCNDINRSWHFFTFLVTGDGMFPSLKPGTWLNNCVWYCLVLNSQHVFYASGVSFANKADMRKTTFLLGGFLGQDVALESVFTLNFAGTC